MKPKNFSGRKNRRRIEALARMLPSRRQSSNEAARLEQLIVDPATARAVQKKKRRAL